MTADVSVYFGASVRLVHGVLPYRDFVLVTPPAFTLLSSPFAWLAEAIGTRDGLAVLRLTTPLLSAVATLSVARLVRHLGTAPTIAAAAVLALFPAELYALRSVLLEPLMNLLCLLGLACAFERGEWSPSRRRVLLAGGLFGLAFAVKVTAFVLLAAVAWIALISARRLVAPLLLGALAGFLVPSAAFIAASPQAFLTDVVAAQAGRAGAGHAVLLIPAAAAAVAVLFARASPLVRFAFLAGAFAGIALFAPAQSYPQYAALLTVPAALLVAVLVHRLARGAPRAAAALVGVGAAALLVTQIANIARLSAPDVASTVDAVIPAGACVVSDKPRLLVTTDRFQSSRAGCTHTTDPFGTSLALGTRSASATATWREMFAHADYVVSDQPIDHWYIDPTPDLLQMIASRFRLQRSGGLWFYFPRYALAVPTTSSTASP